MITLICIPKAIGTAILLILLLVLVVAYVVGIVFQFKKSLLDGFITLGIGAAISGLFVLADHLLNYPCE